MNYPAIPSWSSPEAAIPERGLPGWVFIIVEIHPYWVIYAAVRGKEIVMVVKQDTVSADAKTKDISISSRTVAVDMAAKETDVAIEARDKAIAIETRTKDAIAEH
jgi:hypothetical protein